jgi:hypothetical protein
VGVSERHSGEISRAKLKMRDLKILRGHKLGCVFSMPSQKASAPWGYIHDLRALAIISFRPYGDGFFSQIPISLASAMLLARKLGNAGDMLPAM